jgi:BMFP domain-containing protein YqiC
MVLGKFTTAIHAAKVIKGMLPDSVYEDMRKYIETQVQSVIGAMNLVSREQYEEQNKKLYELQEKIERLERSAETYEQQSNQKPR